MVATSREKRQSIKRHFHYRNQHSSFEMANWVKILLISLDFNGKTRKCYPKMLLGAQLLSALFRFDITIQGGNLHEKYFPSFLVIAIGKITSSSQGQTSSGPLFQQSQSWGWLGGCDKSIVDETNDSLLQWWEWFSTKRGILSKDFDLLPFEHVAGLLQPTLDCSAINSAQSESAFTIVLEPWQALYTFNNRTCVSR